MAESTKDKFKIITRWLARHYDKETEQAVFYLQREIDGLNIQLEAELKDKRDECND